AACRQPTEGTLPPPGPDMELEPHWVHIFDTLGKCYAALDNTSYKEKAWQEHLQQCVLWVANNGGTELLQLEEGKSKERLGELADFYYDRKEDRNILEPLLDRLEEDIDKKLLEHTDSAKEDTCCPIL